MANNLSVEWKSENNLESISQLWEKLENYTNSAKNLTILPQSQQIVEDSFTDNSFAKCWSSALFEQSSLSHKLTIANRTQRRTSLNVESVEFTQTANNCRGVERIILSVSLPNTHTIGRIQISARNHFIQPIVAYLCWRKLLK